MQVRVQSSYRASCLLLLEFAAQSIGLNCGTRSAVPASRPSCSLCCRCASEPCLLHAVLQRSRSAFVLSSGRSLPAACAAPSAVQEGTGKPARCRNARRQPTRALALCSRCYARRLTEAPSQQPQAHDAAILRCRGVGAGRCVWPRRSHGSRRLRRARASAPATALLPGVSGQDSHRPAILRHLQE